MKLSIITVNYNNLQGLEKTMQSVFAQTFTDYEYIIIDGGSTDGSKELIEEHADKFSYWVSEPDKGIFHAMNKGILKANGDYLLMLNSGDVLAGADVLSKVFHENFKQADIIYGDVYREVNGEIFTESIFPEDLSFRFLKQGALSHQATFIRKTLHDTIGLYDEMLRLSADWAFILLAVCKYSASYQHFHYKIAVCNAEGATCAPSNFTEIAKNRQAILAEHFPAFMKDYDQFERQQRKTIPYVIDKVKNNVRSGVKSILKTYFTKKGS